MTTIDSDIASIPHTLKFRHSLSLSLSLFYLRSLTDFTLKIWRHKSNAEMKRVCLPATAAQPQSAAAQTAAEQPQLRQHQQQCESSRVPFPHRSRALSTANRLRSTRYTYFQFSLEKHRERVRSAVQCAHRKRYKEINFKLKERERKKKK